MKTALYAALLANILISVCSADNKPIDNERHSVQEGYSQTHLTSREKAKRNPNGDTGRLLFKDGERGRMPNEGRSSAPSYRHGGSQQPGINTNKQYDSVAPGKKHRIPVHTKEWTDHNDSDPGLPVSVIHESTQEKTEASDRRDNSKTLLE